MNSRKLLQFMGVVLVMPVVALPSGGYIRSTQLHSWMHLAERINGSSVPEPCLFSVRIDSAGPKIPFAAGLS